MSEERSLVKNAADPVQVKRAGRKQRDCELAQLDRVRQVLRTYDGRAFCWDRLTELGVHRSIFAESAAQTAYQAGRQDAGHAFMALLLRADEDAYDLMAREARARAKREDTEIAAVHQEQAEEQPV